MIAFIALKYIKAVLQCKSSGSKKSFSNPSLKNSVLYRLIKRRGSIACMVKLNFYAFANMAETASPPGAEISFHPPGFTVFQREFVTVPGFGRHFVCNLQAGVNGSFKLCRSILL